MMTSKKAVCLLKAEKSIFNPQCSTCVWWNCMWPIHNVSLDNKTLQHRAHAETNIDYFQYISNRPIDFKLKP